MIKFKKQLTQHLLKSIADMDLTLSLVIKSNGDNKYVNGNECGMDSKSIDSDSWKIETDDGSRVCSATTSELNWVSYNEEDIEVVGYFVFDETSVLFYDIFKESVTLEKGRPFSLIPHIAIPFHPSDADFLNSID